MKLEQEKAKIEFAVNELRQEAERAIAEAKQHTARVLQDALLQAESKLSAILTNFNALQSQNEQLIVVKSESEKQLAEIQVKLAPLNSELHNAQTELTQLQAELSRSSSAVGFLAVTDSESLEQAYRNIWKATKKMVLEGKAPIPLKNRAGYAISAIVDDFTEEISVKLREIIVQLKAVACDMEFNPTILLHTTIFSIAPFRNLEEINETTMRLSEELADRVKKIIMAVGKISILFKGVKYGPDGAIFI